MKRYFYKKISILLIFLLGFSLSLHSQSFGINQAVIRAMLLPRPGGFVEATFGEKLTFTHELFLEINYRTGWDVSLQKKRTVFYPGLFYAGGLRYYYNLDRRRSIKRHTDNFTGDYVMLRFRVPCGKRVVQTSFPDVVIYRSSLFSLLWGLQREFHNWTYGVELGLQTAKFTFPQDVLELTINLRFAYNIFSYKKTLPKNS